MGDADRGGNGTGPTTGVDHLRLARDDDYLDDVARRAVEMLGERDHAGYRIGVKEIWPGTPDAAANRIAARIGSTAKAEAEEGRAAVQAEIEERETRGRAVPQRLKYPHPGDPDLGDITPNPDDARYRDILRRWIRDLLLHKGVEEVGSREAYETAVKVAGYPDDADSEADGMGFSTEYRRFIMGPWKWGKHDAEKVLEPDEEEEVGSQPEPAPEPKAPEATTAPTRPPRENGRPEEIHVKTDHGELSLHRFGDRYRCTYVGFVSQRRVDHLLAFLTEEMFRGA